MANFPSTPHINVQNEIGFGKTVLMPGDPLRAKFIAENFLENPVLVNNVRGVHGYTGYYKGVKVSVMASGMGMPAIGIYSHELFNFFGVENIIRVGSAGSIQEHIHVYDLVIGQGACTNSAYQDQYKLNGNYAPIASYELLSRAVEEAKAIGVRYQVGNLLSSDVFYNADPSITPKYAKMGVLGVEMEAAALYMNAARAKKRALAVCTVSDHLFTGETLSSDERQTSFTEMIEIALNAALTLRK
mgnify:CR=1 FL=1